MCLSDIQGLCGGKARHYLHNTFSHLAQHWASHMDDIGLLNSIETKYSITKPKNTILVLSVEGFVELETFNGELSESIFL